MKRKPGVRHAVLLATALLHGGALIVIAQDNGSSAWREAPGQRGPAIVYLSAASITAADTSGLPANGPIVQPASPSRLPPARHATAPMDAPASTAPVIYSDAADAHALAADAVSPEAGSQASAGTVSLPDGGTQRYQFALPPSARLNYSRAIDGGAEEGSALLDWRHDGERYRLELSGFPDNALAAGLPASSTGATDDNGIAPQVAIERAGIGHQRDLVFDRGTAVITAEGGASSPLLQGAQDRASMLMQLAGIGLESAEQMRHAVDLYVAAAGQARLVRFAVAEPARLQLPAGTFDAVHLVEQAAPGHAHIELWLAPGLSWLPVQLRYNGPAGAGLTLRLRQHDMPPASSPSPLP